MPPTPDYPIVLFADRGAFRTWLSAHHASRPGLWLRIAKAASPLTSVTYAEALDVALCFGWIDGQKRSLDARCWLQRFTPRRARSIWSRINRDKVAVLIAQKRMRPSGMREVERARADGRWDAAYAGARTAEVPPDFAAALARDARAKKFFAALDGANRYALLFRLQNVKRAETRARKVREFVAMMRDGKKLHERRPKKGSTT